MKRLSLLVVLILCACSLQAEPLRVLLLDFENATGTESGLVDADAMASKGMYLLSKELLGNPDIVLLDRREFVRQMDKMKLRDQGESTSVRPTFIQAAQLLNADVVLRGTLLTLSGGKEVVDQGGYKTEFTKLTARVALEALDATDGTVIAMSEGASSEKIRQTKTQQTVLGEDEVLSVMGRAVSKAVPELQSALQARIDVQRGRTTIKLSLTTSADPALVEIDGSLVGSTPIEGLGIYAGDHVLRVSKAGYRDITKRMVLEKDTQIEIPLMRVELDAIEKKEVLEKADLDIIVGEPDLIIKTID